VQGDILRLGKLVYLAARHAKKKAGYSVVRCRIEQSLAIGVFDTGCRAKTSRKVRL